MKSLTNPEEFCIIHKADPSFLKITDNFRMREFISSYGFRAPREMAATLLDLRDKRS